MVVHKVSSQMEYGRQLIADARAKLSELEAERDCMKSKLDSVRPEEGGLHLNYIDPGMVDFEGLQQRIQAQKRILAVFEETCGGRQAETIELSKLENADEAWSVAKNKQHLWKRHRLAFQSQLRGMKCGYERPATTPAPLPTMYNDYREECVHSEQIHIGVCPFCLQGFEPAWDCCLASCRHAYHSWCALTHFSESTKCIHKGCAKEMHSDWWISTGIPKPEFGKDGLVMAAPWERTPLTRNAFLTLPLICDWIHILKFREWVLACVGGGCCWGMFPGPRLISVKFVAISSGSKLISVFLTHLLLSSLFLNGWETSLPICVLSHYSVSECSYLWQIEFLHVVLRKKRRAWCFQPPTGIHYPTA